MGCGTARALGESGKGLRMAAIIAVPHPRRCTARIERLAAASRRKNKWEQRMGAGG